MKEKISVNLVGGLGNNLFGIACTYAYSLKYNKELVFVNEKFGTTHNPLSSYKDNILHKIDFVDKKNFDIYEIYNEPHFNYSEIPKIDGNVLLNGYFQSELYFKEYKQEIRELFSFPEEIINSIKEKYKNILDKNTCSIHVRRGDYLNLPDQHPSQNINYFMKAIRKMPEDSLFLVFSDDIAWCKENFPNIEDKFIFIEGSKDWEDILLISLCKNNIISNSSFSWWGTFLNNNVDKIVIAPNAWVGKSLLLDTSDLYCENWIKI